MGIQDARGFGKRQDERWRHLSAWSSRGRGRGEAGALQAGMPLELRQRRQEKQVPAPNITSSSGTSGRDLGPEPLSPLTTCSLPQVI